MSATLDVRRDFEILPPHALEPLIADGNSLLAALPAAIYTTDAAGRITYFNEAAARDVGLPPGTRQKRMVRLVEALLA